MGRALERRRFEFLPELADGAVNQMNAETASDRALVLGDGDGRFLALLLEVHSALEVDYVDSSGEMLALARKRVLASRQGAETARRVTFHHTDARTWLPAAACRYRWLFTHFFLDCLSGLEVDELLDKLLPFATPDAAWIVSEFHQPSSGLAAWRARVWIGGLYRVFGLTTGLQVRRLPDYRRRLQTHGFRMQREVLAEWGLLVSEWWQRGPGGFCD